ncbi:hypothetical protein E4U41_003628, partial [Claviceps citrina]
PTVPGASEPTQPAGAQTGPAGEPVGPPAISGTGDVFPSTPTGPVPVTAGAGRVGAGMMIAAAAFLAVL